MSMKKYRIEFEIRVPEEIPEDQIKEWARFMCGDTGKLDNENPLVNYSFDAELGTLKIEVVQQ